MGALMQEAGPTRRPPIGPADLEAARRRTIAEVQRLEGLLGKAHVRGRKARRGGLVARNLEKREQLKVELRHHAERLRILNAAIKAGHRAGNLLLLHGLAEPRDERELVALLYRVFTDAVPPAEQNERERGAMRLARDYVTSGALATP
jgi:hypothetical protein